MLVEINKRSLSWYSDLLKREISHSNLKNIVNGLFFWKSEPERNIKLAYCEPDC